jgi:hypothetical protein
MAIRKEAGTDRQAVEYGDQRVERGQGARPTRWPPATHPG